MGRGRVNQDSLLSLIEWMTDRLSDDLRADVGSRNSSSSVVILILSWRFEVSTFES